MTSLCCNFTRMVYKEVPAKQNTVAGTLMSNPESLLSQKASNVVHFLRDTYCLALKAVKFVFKLVCIYVEVKAKDSNGNGW